MTEEYHQDYYKKNPMRYIMYYKGSGRQAFIERSLLQCNIWLHRKMQLNLPLAMNISDYEKAKQKYRKKLELLKDRFTNNKE